MSRLLVVSDLHFEFYDDHGAEVAVLVCERFYDTKSDVLVVAGDLCNSRILYDSLAKLRKYCTGPIVYVTGNHEHYHSSIEDVRDACQALPAGVVYLDNDFAFVDGIRFIGGTGWFPYNANNMMFEHLMSDFRLISKLKRDYSGENAKFRAAVDEHCRSRDVVVSHHLPSYQSVPSRFKSSNLNRFFVGEFDELIYTKKPKLWIHGHTHDSCDYTIGDTRVVCNPLGYPHERSRSDSYDFGMVVDV